MDLFKSFLRVVTPMEEIAKIDYDIDRANHFMEQRGLNARCKCTDCNRISVNVRKKYCTHTGTKNIVLHSHINQ